MKRAFRYRPGGVNALGGQERQGCCRKNAPSVTAVCPSARTDDDASQGVSDLRGGTKDGGLSPIFIPNGHKRTFAEMSKSHKYKIDHRAKAFKKIKKFF